MAVNIGYGGNPLTNIFQFTGFGSPPPPGQANEGSQIVAQTSASPLVQPISRKRYAAILAAQDAKIEQAERDWSALSPLVQLQVQLKVAGDDRDRAMSKYRDTQDHQWLRKAQDIHKRIEKLQHEYQRHELAEAYKTKHKN